MVHRFLLVALMLMLQISFVFFSLAAFLLIVLIRVCAVLVGQFNVSF